MQECIKNGFELKFKNDGMNDFKRRTFFKLGLAGAALSIFKPSKAADLLEQSAVIDSKKFRAFRPTVVSTWNHGMEANAAAWEILGENGSALDAVEKGVMVTESDLTNRSVGIGGLPDAKPEINHENHDTIGMLALDAHGNLSGACTTSGWAYKMHGRVGDSPIIGAGLFVDNEIGAACATGMGEAVIRIAGSHTVVELMRQGNTPQQACEKAVNRIIRKHKDLTNLQVGFVALNKAGDYGSYSVYAGFNVAVQRGDEGALKDAPYLMEW